MSDQLPAVPVHPADASRAFRVLALVAVCLGVAALAGAAFVLSYPGIHAFALQAGISARLARGYPLIFDVLLVVIGAAVLSLRGAGLPSRLLAWICLLALLTAAAGADALHAAGRKLPAQTSAVTAAIVPWALVLIAFALLLAMLRQARLRRLASAGDPAAGSGGGARAGRQPPEPPPLSTVSLVPGLAPRPAGPGRATLRLPVPQPAVPRQLTPDSAAESAAPAGPGETAPAKEAGGELAAETDGASDDASTEENSPDPADPQEHDQPQADDNGTSTGTAVGVLSPAPTPADASVDPEMPVFHRLWSSPVPPADEDA